MSGKGKEGAKEGRSEARRARCIARCNNARAGVHLFPQHLRPAAALPRRLHASHATPHAGTSAPQRRTIWWSPAPSSLSSAQNPAKWATAVARNFGLFCCLLHAEAAWVRSFSRTASDLEGRSVSRGRCG